MIFSGFQALFKARFEQALDSQKLNIKEYEQKLRKKGINPDDPVAMASIQRVASTFFNAIDQKEGSPYIFQGDKSNQVGASSSNIEQQSDEESDQEELDRFIADIEREADREWAAEEAAEKEELGKIRYWNQEDFAGQFRRSESNGSDESDNEMVGRTRSWNDKRGRKIVHDDSDEDGDVSEDDDDGWDSDDIRGNTHNGEYKSRKQNIQSWPKHKTGKDRGQGNSKIYGKPKFEEKMSEEESASDDMLNDLEDVMWESDDGDDQSIKESGTPSHDYRTKQMNNERNGGNKKRNGRKLKGMDDWDSD